MRKYHIILFALIVICLISCDSEKTDSNLWEISGKNLQKESYIYGTIHLTPIGGVPLRSEIRKILTESDIVAFEAQMDTIYPTEKKTVIDCISPIEQEQLSAYLRDSLHMNKQDIDSMLLLDPNYFSLFLIKEYFGPLAYPDRYYYKLAKSLNKKMYYLDSYAKILGYQQNMTDEVWYGYDSIRTSYLRNLKLINDHYKLERGESVDSFMRHNEHIKDARSMIIARNMEWISSIDSLIQDNQILIFVGAGHLGGDWGLIKLLRNNNYRLKPI